MAQELGLARQHAANLEAEESSAALRRREARDARRARDEETSARLRALRELGVDLTAYLTQGRADQIFEVRGGSGTHLHLPAPG